MKFKLVREKFAKALGIAQKAISVKSSLPILQNVLLESDEGRVKIVTSDLEKSIVTWVGGKVDGEGGLTVPAKSLYEFVNGLKDEYIEGEVVGESLKLKTKTAEATFNGMGVDEYPAVDYTISENKMQIPSSVLKSSVDETHFSSSKDDMRPSWTGILLKLVDDHLHFVGLDGYRLSRRKLPLTSLPNLPKDLIDMIVPSKNLLEIIRLAPNDSDISLDFQPKTGNVVFDLNDLYFISKVLDGDFPDYNAVIPKTPVSTFSVAHADLLNAVKLASVFSKETEAVRLSLKPKDKLLSILSDDVELGNHKQEIALSESTGDDMELAFKVSYLLDFLNNVPCESITVQCSGQTTPSVFIPDNRTDYLHVAVPLQPYWE